MKEEQETKKSVQLAKQIIYTAYTEDYASAMSLNPDVEITGKWVEPWLKFRRALEVIPAQLDTTMTNMELTEHFEALGINPDDISLSLWGFFEDGEITFDLSDDGTDCMEQQLDRLAQFVRDILDRSKSILYPTYIGDEHIRSEYLNEGHPQIWISQKVTKEFIEALGKEVGDGPKNTWNNPYYSKSLDAFINDNKS